jgi:hypothetical protein
VKRFWRFDDFWASLTWRYGYAGWVMGADMWAANRQGMEDIKNNRFVTADELRSIVQ